MRKMIRSMRRRLFVMVALLGCCMALTGCLSHWFIDTTTRLQVENATDVAILGIDIVSEDGSSVTTWVSDTIQPGEKSRVYEEDWVGTFRMRVRFEERDDAEAEMEFEGGSQYLVVSTDKDGNAEFNFR